LLLFPGALELESTGLTAIQTYVDSEWASHQPSENMKCFIFFFC
jgi:hypothetical protein